MIHKDAHKGYVALASLALVSAILFCSGCETLKDINLADIYQQGTGAPQLDEKTVAAGLREALQVGTGNAVGQTSSVDGFLGNALIKIVIPENMDPVVNTLRKIGLGYKVDELEVGMNRAAERSAGQAKDIFWNAITSMSVSDAFAILRGGDTAATDYFRAQTGDALRGRITPIVHDTVIEVGLAQVYNQVMDRYNSIPLVDKPEMGSLDAYVTDKTLDGLFTVLAGEELKIRQDPLARTTDLLRLVFNEVVKP